MDEVLDSLEAARRSRLSSRKKFINRVSRFPSLLRIS